MQRLWEDVTDGFGHRTYDKLDETDLSRNCRSGSLPLVIKQLVGNTSLHLLENKQKNTSYMIYGKWSHLENTNSSHKNRLLNLLIYRFHYHKCPNPLALDPLNPTLNESPQECRLECG